MITSLQLSPNVFAIPHAPLRASSSSSSVSAVSTGLNVSTEDNANILQLESTKDRIRKLFDNVQLSVSSYDTAWVALVPSPTSSVTPYFPECLDWLLDNQHSDGSWGLFCQSRFLVKDNLSSTLASILALKRWGIGNEQIDRGLHFIESNNASLVDGNKSSPIGFDIIFPGLVKHAEDLNLSIPLEPSILDTMLRKRELELKRAYADGRNSYLAYISEGVGKSQDWDMAMKYQRKNGSLFNSPSATAAAYMHLEDAGCLNYLNSLLAKFGNAVPAVGPLDIYIRLSMVDSLEKLGIDRHFEKEIQSVLDETYKCWQQGEEEIFGDITTCTMAFRLLRLNGYDVSSDRIMQITEEDLDLGPRGGHSALELYRASELILHPDESALGTQNSWCGQLLKQKLNDDAFNSDRLDKHTRQEVDDIIKSPFYATLDRMASMRAIKNYSVDGTRLLKTSYCSPNIGNKDFLELAVEDFNICQSIHREELKNLDRWVVEQRLGKLEFARQRVLYCYFSASVTFFSPELCDARISWAKFCTLCTVVDDFFDAINGGSMQEIENLFQLFQKWDVDVAAECCSEVVEIIFSAVHSTICELGAKASALQGRDVTSHFIEIWLNYFRSLLVEVKWAKDKSIPTMDEYMRTARITFSLGPDILPALYFVGPKLQEEVVSSSEYLKLFELVSDIGRLLNDAQTFERESKAGQLNVVSLLMIHENKSFGEVSEEITSTVARKRTELLEVVLRKEGSLVPQGCKDLVWKMSKIVHFFFKDHDAFTSDDMKSAVKTFFYEPISLSEQ